MIVRFLSRSSRRFLMDRLERLTEALQNLVQFQATGFVKVFGA